MADVSQIEYEDELYDIKDEVARQAIESLPSNTDFIKQIGNVLFPVGSIISRYDDVSPENVFGGTWVQITGRYIYASDASSTAGSTRGRENFTIAANNLPAHTHSFTQPTITCKTGVFVMGGNSAYGIYNNQAGRDTGCAYASGGAVGNNTTTNDSIALDPSAICLSFWRRTALYS